jgi:hypothetical protein
MVGGGVDLLLVLVVVWCGGGDFVAGCLGNEGCLLGVGMDLKGMLVLVEGKEIGR